MTPVPFLTVHEPRRALAAGCRCITSMTGPQFRATTRCHPLPLSHLLVSHAAAGRARAMEAFSDGWASRQKTRQRDQYKRQENARRIKESRSGKVRKAGHAASRPSRSQKKRSNAA
ncbi:hypothetical protein MRX96_005547 [Rhipicephalus microplus]